MKQFAIMVVVVMVAGGCGGHGRYYDRSPSVDRYEETVRGPDDESYERIGENGFRAVDRRPLSTFALDVDTASYSNVRRFLENGQRPPADAVRIEELINYFSYDYPDPDDGRPFSVVPEIGECPWNRGHKLVRIGIQGKRMSTRELPPVNLVFLLDVSGSMEAANKLPLVKASVRLLVEKLRRRDRAAIVVYAGESRVLLPSTPGSAKEKILDAVDGLRAGGSTNGGEGILQAYRIARENFIPDGVNRIILATDGDFNVGVTDREELVRLVEEKRKSGIFLSVFGYGMGNLKDATLEKLADRGNGHYGYIDSIDEARKAFAREAGATLATIAADVKAQVEFNPRRVASYRLIGYENRLMRDRDFRNDAKDAGEIGAGHAVTILYEVVPTTASADDESGDAIPLKYQKGRRVDEDVEEDDGDEEILTIRLRYKEPNLTETGSMVRAVRDRGTRLSMTSDDFRFAAAVAAFGMLLRDSDRSGMATWRSVHSLAEGAVGDDPHGDRGEFLTLVRRASRLKE